MQIATVIILLQQHTHFHSKGCFCQCSDSPSSPQCTKCIGTDGNCSKFQETCRYYESIDAPNCQNERVINGLCQTKSDCCSDQFISQNISNRPIILIYRVRFTSKITIPISLCFINPTTPHPSTFRINSMTTRHVPTDAAERQG